MNVILTFVNRVHQMLQTVKLLREINNSYVKG